MITFKNNAFYHNTSTVSQLMLLVLIWGSSSYSLFSSKRTNTLHTLDFWIDKVETDLEQRMEKLAFRKLKNKLNKIWRTKKKTLSSEGS